MSAFNVLLICRCVMCFWNRFAGGAGYDSSASAAPFQMHNMELNAAAQRTAVTNIMLAAEQIRVDCVQLTTNGRYVVTGSIYGPPQVWDLKVWR